MKKKSLMTMLATLSLVAVVGVGATLAYLSDKTDPVTNTFTVGNVDITLDEEKFGSENERTDEGNKYENIQPGDVLTKDPTVHLSKGSEEAYVFLEVSGLDDFLAAEGLDKNGNPVPLFTLDDQAYKGWKKADGLETKKDGIYYYENTLVDKENEKDTTPFFNQITFNTKVVEYKNKEVPTIENIVITAHAIQKEHVATPEAAYTELFGSRN